MFMYRAPDNTLRYQFRYRGGGMVSEQNLDVSLQGDPSASVVPGTDILQVFFRMPNNHLGTIWRLPYAVWSSPEDLGGDIESNPAAVVLPGTNILQVYYCGAGNTLYTRWRPPTGSWSYEQNFPDTSCQGDPIIHRVPGTDKILILYRAPDGSLRVLERYKGGGMAAEQNLGITLQGDPSAAVVRGTDTIQVFFCNTTGALASIWRFSYGVWRENPQILATSMQGNPSVIEVPAA